APKQGHGAVADGPGRRQGGFRAITPRQRRKTRATGEDIASCLTLLLDASTRASSSFRPPTQRIPPEKRRHARGRAFAVEWRPHPTERASVERSAAGADPV